MLSPVGQPSTSRITWLFSAIRPRASGRPLRALDRLRGHAAIGSLRNVTTVDSQLPDMPRSVRGSSCPRFREVKGSRALMANAQFLFGGVERSGWRDVRGKAVCHAAVAVCP